MSSSKGRPFKSSHHLYLNSSLPWAKHLNQSSTTLQRTRASSTSLAVLITLEETTNLPSLYLICKVQVNKIWISFKETSNNKWIWWTGKCRSQTWSFKTMQESRRTIKSLTLMPTPSYATKRTKTTIWAAGGSRTIWAIVLLEVMLVRTSMLNLLTTSRMHLKVEMDSMSYPSQQQTIMDTGSTLDLRGESLASPWAHKRFRIRLTLYSIRTSRHSRNKEAVYKEALRVLTLLLRTKCWTPLTSSNWEEQDRTQASD